MTYSGVTPPWRNEPRQDSDTRAVGWLDKEVSTWQQRSPMRAGERAHLVGKIGHTRRSARRSSRTVAQMGGARAGEDRRRSLHDVAVTWSAARTPSAARFKQQR